MSRIFSERICADANAALPILANTFPNLRWCSWQLNCGLRFSPIYSRRFRALGEIESEYAPHHAPWARIGGLRENRWRNEQLLGRISVAGGGGIELKSKKRSSAR